MLATLARLSTNFPAYSRALPPYRANDGRENVSSDARRVLRGGSWGDFQVSARAVYRGYFRPFGRVNDLGFRCVVVRPPSL
jgi:formylglycine-generating enzyme required for sulfatase activity